MFERYLHVIHLLIRRIEGDSVRFFLYPHDKWISRGGDRYLSMPTKKSAEGLFGTFKEGAPLEAQVQSIMHEDLALEPGCYSIEQTIEPATLRMDSPTWDDWTEYKIHGVDIRLSPEQQNTLQQILNGEWWICQEALQNPRISPSARKVFNIILAREQKLTEKYSQNPAEELREGAARRLLQVIRAPSNT